jgi:hypothetical protein
MWYLRHTPATYALNFASSVAAIQNEHPSRSELTNSLSIILMPSMLFMLSLTFLATTVSSGSYARSLLILCSAILPPPITRPFFPLMSIKNGK